MPSLLMPQLALLTMSRIPRACVTVFEGKELPRALLLHLQYSDLTAVQLLPFHT